MVATTSSRIVIVSRVRAAGNFPKPVGVLCVMTVAAVKVVQDVWRRKNDCASVPSATSVEAIFAELDASVSELTTHPTFNFKALRAVFPLHFRLNRTVSFLKNRRIVAILLCPVLDRPRKVWG
jgi:hypothetical protein